jgi:hypothetical protein
MVERRDEMAHRLSGVRFDVAASRQALRRALPHRYRTQGREDLHAIEDGNYNPTLTKRLSALETDKAKAETDLANAAARPELRIHPTCRRSIGARSNGCRKR